jgi:hypothetical protein
LVRPARELQGNDLDGPLEPQWGATGAFQQLALLNLSGNLVSMAALLFSFFFFGVFFLGGGGSCKKMPKT